MPDGADRAKAIIAAMVSIEEAYDSLRGVLPKSEYQELGNDVLGQLLRTLNPDELKRVEGDVFGRIYEYFLTSSPSSPTRRRTTAAILHTCFAGLADRPRTGPAARHGA